MNSLKWLLAGVLIAGAAFLFIAADNTKRPGYYDDLGFTAGDMVGFVIDSSTTTGYQLKRVVISTALDVTEASGGTADSDYTVIWTCPAGVTLSIDSVFLWALTEGDVDGDTPGGFRINVRYYDLSAAAYDTLVNDVCDKESLAYDLQNAFLSWSASNTSKTLNSGDAIVAMLEQDSAFVTSAACTYPMLTIKARLDE